MRIFSVNRSFSEGKEILNNLNCNLSSLDVRTLIHVLEKAKLADSYEATQAASILTNLKSFNNE